MKYGHYLEKGMSKNSYGNRLLLDKESGSLISQRSLFKPYVRQFQNWWSLAIKTIKGHLEKGDNATMINFDIQSFYHEVNFSFTELEKDLAEYEPEITDDIIHILLKKIHVRYKEKWQTYRSDNFENEGFPLPIGLFTSHVFANWHLKTLDKFVEKEIRPMYYGRYVDDVLIVVNDTVLDTDELAGKDKETIVSYYLRRYFGDLLKAERNGKYKFEIDNIKQLALSEEKLFIYQFDAKYSPSLIDKFVDEQKERSSMFRFLSDEEDDFFDDFEKITFESNFDHIDANKARFKQIEDNKYKLSSFFSKLIKRKILRGEGYKDANIDDICKYFKGGYLIKHYYFWEKLFTMLVIYERYDKLIELINEIISEIENTDYIQNENVDFQIKSSVLRKWLKEFLVSSLQMAVGLNLGILYKDLPLKKAIDKALNFDKTLYYDEEGQYTLFKKSGLLRGTFVYYPLLQFTSSGINDAINLTAPDSIFKVESFVILNKEFLPFRVKFWQVAILTFYKNLFDIDHKNNLNKNYWFTDQFSSKEILDKAFDLFYEINKPKTEKNKLKSSYFQISDSKFSHARIDDTEIRIPESRNMNYYIQELFIKNGGKSLKKARICIVNKFVDLKNFEASLDGAPNIYPQRVEVFDRILDDISKVKDCDIFVLPELALPHALSSRYIEQSARKQIGFVSGVEHLNYLDTGLNFILTTLPINVNGDKDAIPVFRLKNHYAPEEETWLKGKRITVPKPNPYRYDLFEWRGLYFSTYYCYELADVFHRSIFFSMVDVIFAPVWNKDTHYYNTIIDVATRDMHNYYVLVNTAQYGFSKLARPRDNVNKEKILVKGGTDDGFTYTLLVGDIYIDKLRKFQSLDYPAQKLANADKKSFKPTPPDFPVENVKKRINNKRFFK